MPELPEVQTTVNGLNRTVKSRRIVDIWNDYDSPYYRGKEEIKNPKFYKKFRKLVIRQKILRAERRAKNILIHLSGGHTIIIHMKMTGHLLYEGYKKDPFNSHIRLKFKLDNGKHLYFSDLRKFAKVTVEKTENLPHSKHLSLLGPEPLEKSFKFEVFKSKVQERPKGKIKQVLIDQTLIAGIGNIYSDEILWRAGVHPKSIVAKIPEKNLRLAFKAMKEVLKKGIKFGGDSMSDYRNIRGEKGHFQEHHRAYKKNKTKCSKRGCSGVLEKTRVGGRSAHFCPVHQSLFS